MTEIVLQQVQVGEEVTWGTPVAATAKLMGIEEISLKPVAESELLPEIRASLAPGYISTLLRVGGEGEFNGGLLYEDICYWFDNLLGEATPTGAGPYTRNYTAPIGTKPTPKILTVIYGETTGGVYKLSGGLVNELTIKGESGSYFTVEGSLIGKDVTTGSLAALSDRTINPVHGAHGKLYIDAWGGTIGTTEVLAAHYAFELKLTSGRATKRHIGSLTPDGYKEDRYDGELKLTLEFTSAVKAYLDAILAPGLFQRQIRIKCSNTASYDVALDFAGFSEEAPQIFNDQDGVATVEMTLKGQYNTALGNWFKSTVINQVSTLP